MNELYFIYKIAYFRDISLSNFAVSPCVFIPSSSFLPSICNRKPYAHSPRSRIRSLGAFNGSHSLFAPFSENKKKKKKNKNNQKEAKTTYTTTRFMSTTKYQLQLAVDCSFFTHRQSFKWTLTTLKWDFTNKSGNWLFSCRFCVQLITRPIHYYIW